MSKLGFSVKARYVITGKLVLISASHFGNGIQGDDINMPILRDKSTGQAFIPGSSIAGALRAYACDYIHGYRYSGQENSCISHLFGYVEDNEAALSNLTVFDSYSSEESVEIRDGVRIDPKTGVVAEHAVFEAEILAKNTRFDLYMELSIPDSESEKELAQTLVCVLEGLANGEIPLGARKSRGLGKCKVEDWKVRRFSLTDRNGWTEWLALAPAKNGPVLDGQSYGSIRNAFSDQMPEPVPLLPNDQRRRVLIDLDLEFEGGVLVRSPGLAIDSVDAPHLRSGGDPVLPGTSLAGVLRARARRIAKIVRKNEDDADTWITEIFGAEASDREEELASSMLLVDESTLCNGKSVRVNRIKIDRFTGGVLDNHLFDEEPLYGASVRTSLELRMPQDDEDEKSKAKLGLLLLCIKDLLDQDLPVGGTSSVGRGYVNGGIVTVRWQNKGDKAEYRFSAEEACNGHAACFMNEAVKSFHKAASISGKEDEW